MIVRDATPEDWESIWQIFQPIVAAGETYTFPRNLDESAAQAAWMEEPPGHVFVAIDDGAVVGSALVHPNHPGAGSHVANASFIVDLGHGGRGVGRALGEHVLGWAAEAGYLAMQFNAVVDTNARAVALWRSLGFEVLGTVPEAFHHPTHGYVGLHIMYRKLSLMA